jgi:uncharacterized protein (UPF0264 family)
MRLLVSVRSADEVRPAVEGGADIIDAKEPARGALGRVSAATLRAILSRVPPECHFSVALGDVGSTEAVNSALAGWSHVDHGSPIYLKLGFAGVTLPATIARVIRHTVRVASRHPMLQVIPVAYADAHRARAVPPHVLLELAAESQASGLLVDTYIKDGRGLLSWLEPGALARWIEAVHRTGLLAAVAGALRPDDLYHLRGMGVDVVGVRGAACEGGREGWVTSDRVRSLRLALTNVSDPVAS